MRLQDIDRKYLARDADPDDVQVARSNGIFVHDARGRRYIDFTSGWNVGARQSGHPRVCRHGTTVRVKGFAAAIEV
jgi:4-aminobutyrate aminotransferase-like enzyme